MEEQQTFNSRIDLTGLNQSVDKLKTEIGKVIIGQEDTIEHLVIAILADGHVLLEGVPGVAKTLIAKLLAKAISIDFSRIQFTPDLMPSDVLGTNVFNPTKSGFEFNKGPIFSNLVLIDEINRAPAKTQSALFEVMEERQITVDGQTNVMAPPFLVFATQNPIEYEGTYRLPEAQLDRFMFKIEVGYPSAEQEEVILDRNHIRENKKETENVEPVLSSEQIVDYQRTVRKIVVEKPIKKYITQIVDKTRNHRSIYLGASPRASINLMIAAMANAAINGRDFVVPEDVKKLVFPVLNHRLVLTPEKEMEGGSIREMIEQIVHSVEVPR